MNENKEIIVAMTDTVTITTEEYEHLIVARTLLESILGYHKAEESYRLSEFVRVIRDIYEPVITAKKPETDGDEDA